MAISLQNLTVQEAQNAKLGQGGTIFIDEWAPDKTFEEENVISTYLDGIISLVDTNSIKNKKFKVCLDLGNGAPVSYTHLTLPTSDLV